MIIEKIEIDWLDKITGLTVSDAIVYLNTLNQSYKLSAYPDGDDLHGVEQYSGLYSERHETQEELKIQRIHYLNRRIKQLETGIIYRQKEVKAGLNVEHHTLHMNNSLSQIATSKQELNKLGGVK